MSTKEILKFVKEEAALRQLLEQDNQVKLDTISAKKGVKWRGLVYAVLAAFFYASQNVPMRKCKVFKSSEIALVRFLMQLLVILPFALKREHNILGEKSQRGMLLLRSSLGAISLLSFYFSVRLITPSDTVALFNCFVIFIPLAARIFLGEKLTLVHVTALGITVAGICLISQPEFLFNKSSPMSINVTHLRNSSLIESSSIQFKQIQLLGCGLALMGSLAYTAVSIITKKLTNSRASLSVISLYASYVGLPTSFFVSLVFFLFESGNRARFSFDKMSILLWDVFYSLIATCLGICGQLLTNMAIKIEDTNKVALLESTDLIFNFMLQYFFLNIKPNYLSTVGATLIGIGVVVVMSYKIAEKNHEAKLSDKKLNKRMFLKKICFYKF